MVISLMRLCALLFAAMAAACSGGAGQAAATAVPSPSAIPTAGLPLAPNPPVPEANQDLLTRAKEARVCGSISAPAPNPGASVAAAIDGRLYVGCGGVANPDGIGSAVLIVDRRMRILQSLRMGMYSIESIIAAGARAVAVSGYSDGAAMRNELSILDSATLKPIVKHQMSDSTFLGVIGDRAYIDDWCCFGRPDVYAPATIYWISLNDGRESKHVDLAPDPRTHPANLAPLGQGEHNYMRGHDFYVVVTDDNRNSITYRYDVFHLDRPPVRMRSAS